MSRALACLLLILLIPFALSSCGSPVASESSTAVPEEPVVIASKKFTESYLLGEMYTQLLLANGIPATHQPNLGDSNVIHAAMRAGTVDLYPEYTSSGLLAILQERTPAEHSQIYERVKKEYARQFNFVWLDLAPLDNTWAIATTHEVSAQHDLTKISQLTELAPQLRLGAEEVFFGREDGLIGLEERYGSMPFAQTRLLTFAERYVALQEGRIDLVVAYGTDGEISGHNLLLLEDDKEFWPPYQVAPVVRQETLDRYPAIPTLLNPLAPLMTQETMAALNWRVDGPENLSYQEVALAFLIENGLLPQTP